MESEFIPSYKFKGVWIPKEIWLSEEITWMEKCLLADIDALDDGTGCFASNEWFAKKFKSSPASIANQISRLRKAGMLETISFNGRQRSLRVNPALTDRLRQNKPLGEGSHNHLVEHRIKGEQRLENTSSDKPKKEISERGIAFANWFKTTLPEGHKLTSSWLQDWATVYDDMIRLDGRTEADIAKVCKWARKDPFWSSNFLSPMKLRKKNGDGTMYFDVFLANEKKPTNSNSTNRNAGTYNDGISEQYRGVQKLATVRPQG